jgi:hypothetical protein
MYRSFSRVRELVPSVTGILERRLRHRDALAHLADAPMRARLTGSLPPRRAPPGRRRPRPRSPLQLCGRAAPDKVTLEEYTIVDGHLNALRAEPQRSDRRQHLDRLVASPQPLRETLRDIGCPLG